MHCLAESRSQGRSDFVQSTITWLLEHVREIVKHPIVARYPHRYSSCLQPFPVKFAVIAQRIILRRHDQRGRQDRKSTRLNSSHQIISYAVFCLKKKKKKKKKK